MLVQARRFRDLQVTEHDLAPPSSVDDAVRQIQAPELVDDAVQVEPMVGAPERRRSRPRPRRCGGRPDLDELVADDLETATRRGHPARGLESSTWPSANADSYARFMGRFSEPLAPLFADLVEVPSDGHGVLDVGCGPGVLTDELVRRYGADRVDAIDPSPAVRRGGPRARCPASTCGRASAEELPYADDAYAAALAQLVVHFMKDPVAGLTEMARVTRPGGVVAACVWDHGGGRGPLSLFWSAVARARPDGADEADASPGSREGDLDRLLGEAGPRRRRWRRAVGDHRPDVVRGLVGAVRGAGRVGGRLPRDPRRRRTRRLRPSAAPGCPTALRAHGLDLGRPRPCRPDRVARTAIAAERRRPVAQVEPPVGLEPGQLRPVHHLQRLLEPLRPVPVGPAARARGLVDVRRSGDRVEAEPAPDVVDGGLRRARGPARRPCTTIRVPTDRGAPRPPAGRRRSR